MATSEPPNVEGARADSLQAGCGTGKPALDNDGKPQLDYDLAVPNMLLHYFPPGMLGLGLTALLASFMSGMAGNVTAFNTVWTYDIYQSLYPTEGERRALFVDGPCFDGRGYWAVDCGGIHGQPLQQHHGHAAVGVCVCERAAVCDVPARNVLEAGDWTRRIHRAAGRNGARLRFIMG